MVNTTLLRQTLAHIEGNPEKWDQRRFHRDFAGWSLRLTQPAIREERDAAGVEVLMEGAKPLWICEIPGRAETLLGLTRDQSVALFCAGNTLDDLRRLVAEYTT